MAEAIALLGVVAAGIQCADVSTRLLLFGSDLCSKLQDAPEKVRRWLDQIQQLITLAESIKQLDAIRIAFPVSLPSTKSKVSWVEAALIDCTAQARTLQSVLEEMLEGVSDSTGQKMWKKILTIKREARILSALHEIERQKALLNIWIGQINLCHLHKLHDSAENIKEGLDKVDRSTLRITQTFKEEVQNLSMTLENSSRFFKSSFESSESLIVSSVESLREDIYDQQQKHQSESAVTHTQLNSLVITF